MPASAAEQDWKAWLTCAIPLLRRQSLTRASSVAGARAASRDKSSGGTCASCSPPIRRAASGWSRRRPGSTWIIRRTVSPTRRCACCWRLPKRARLRERIDAMFRGDKINATERARGAARRAARAAERAHPRRWQGRGAGRACGARPHGGVRRTACAAASGPVTAASASATSSTSASAARTSAR